jgi:hypothetical protein
LGGESSLCSGQSGKSAIQVFDAWIPDFVQLLIYDRLDFRVGRFCCPKLLEGFEMFLEPDSENIVTEKKIK